MELYLIDTPQSPIGLDSLSILFLIPVLLIWAIGTIYSSWYLASEQWSKAQVSRMRFFWGIILTGMILLLIARQSIIFLFGWELMALSAFFLIAADDRNQQARRAAWIYLVASHLGTASLLALFLLMSKTVGSLTWGPLPPVPPFLSSIIFLLALFGFGIKAGIMPFHVWLPGAHANAPSHVSALMSGVVIKMGIYGLLRVLSYMPILESWWGVLLIGLGLISAFLGIIAAAQQHDLKRSLAFSSIENIGIITTGIGMVILGQTEHIPMLSFFGGGAALYHIFAHSVFKALLFLCSGAIIHATGTRDLNGMGGLGNSLPIARVGFYAGAISAAALPIGSGFITEFLLILGFGNGLISTSRLVTFVSACSIIVLVGCGTIAGVSFSRLLFGIFAGMKHGLGKESKPEVSTALRGSLIVLVIISLTQGIFPGLFVPLIPDVLSSAFPNLKDAVGYSLMVSFLNPLCAILMAIILFVFLASLRMWSLKSNCTLVSTWDCGYVNASSPRLQYTPSSFAELLGAVFSSLAPQLVHSPSISKALPGTSAYRSVLPERLLRDLLLPFLKRWENRFSSLRIVQQGKIQVYILYIYVCFLVSLFYSIVYSRSG